MGSSSLTVSLAYNTPSTIRRIMTLFKNVECLQEYKVREQRNVNLDMGNRAHAPILVKKKTAGRILGLNKKSTGRLDLFSAVYL